MKHGPTNLIAMSISDIVDGFFDISKSVSHRRSDMVWVSYGQLEWETPIGLLNSVLDKYGDITSINGVALLASPDDDAYSDATFERVAKWLRDKTIISTYNV